MTENLARSLDFRLLFAGTEAHFGSEKKYIVKPSHVLICKRFCGISLNSIQTKQEARATSKKPTVRNTLIS